MNSNTLADIGKLILRLTLGILILFHGADKLLHGIGPIQAMITGRGLPGFLAYGVYLGEVLGPLLLVLGFQARIGAGLIAINMVIAVLLVHTGDLLGLSPQGGWRLELQGMFLFTALALVLLGPGRFGLNDR
jgi:putative oxidoreductase